MGNIAGKLENLERGNANGAKFKVSNFSIVSKDDDGKKFILIVQPMEIRQKI